MNQQQRENVGIYLTIPSATPQQSDKWLELSSGRKKESSMTYFFKGNVELNLFSSILPKAPL